MRKRNKTFAFVFLIMFVFLSACSSTSGTATEYQKISAEDAKERMNNDNDVIILDVRTQEEYEEKHLEGAILIPNETIADSVLDEIPDLDAEILVYCRSGNRSRQAAEKLLNIGYTNVYDFGGINDWPYETVSDN